MLDEPVHCTLSAGQYRHFVLVCMHTHSVFCVLIIMVIYTDFFLLFFFLALSPSSVAAVTFDS